MISRCTCLQAPGTLNWHDVRFHALEHARSCGYDAEVIRRIETDDRASMAKRWNKCGGTFVAFVQSYRETVTHL